MSTVIDPSKKAMAPATVPALTGVKAPSTQAPVQASAPACSSALTAAGQTRSIKYSNVWKEIDKIKGNNTV